MLNELSIRNYALIENLSLSFEDSLTILTGETGAGKSIIVGALSFLLGGKADVSSIRAGAEEALIQAEVSTKNKDALAWLQSRGLETEAGQVFLRRSLKQSGKSSAYIQNTAVSRAELEEFTSFIFDLHGQHAHESLLKKESHRVYLDNFGKLDAEVETYNKIFLEMAEKKRLLEASLNAGKDREVRLDILGFAVEEIDKAALKAGEIRDLEAELARLADFEKLSSLINNTLDALSDGSETILSQSRHARASAEAASQIDPSLENNRRRLEALFYEAEDLAGEFRAYRDELKADPERLEEVSERLSHIRRLQKKYLKAPLDSGIEEALITYRNEAASEIEALSGLEENRDKLEAEIKALEQDVAKRALVLSSKRNSAAGGLGEGITAIISKLGMPKARFEAHSVQRRRENGSLICGPYGADEIEFLFSANAGEPLKELSRIASGGELSRVMLAIKTVVLTENGDSATIIFDEIDTGIGGEVALAVAEYLAKIAVGRQVMVVTHLASIAVRATHHLKVEKDESGGRTITSVRALNREERRKEIARMLAGDSGGEAALAHADALLEKYDNKVKIE
ncbi:MAG: DNA repair protein RecN [Spirochaetaceae bacterium]|jgi:DNA repair protein RecN (Recombination protein N)|nr:DNA repair protein RecN [Spirochaetaceae bacterium]